MTTSRTHDSWAEALFDAERQATTVAPLVADEPAMTIEDAYAIQVAGLALRQGDGGRLVGWKVGLTNPVVQRAFNVDRPDFGYLLDRWRLEDGDVIAAGELIQPKVEPEIAFILDADLAGPGVTSLDVLAATRWVVPALEIIDSRIESWKISIVDTVADNASSGRVVLGRNPVDPAGIDLALVGTVLEHNGRIAGTGAGAAALGHPANAIAWLANTLGEHGQRMEAGQVVLPGAVTATLDARPGDTVRATFDRIGSVSVTFGSEADQR